MAYVTPTTRAAGYKVPASVWNSDVVANVRMLAEGGWMIRSNSAVQAIPNNTWTPVNFNTLTAASTLLPPIYSTSDDEFNFQAAGRYQIEVACTYSHSTNSTGGFFRLLSIASSTGAGAGSPIAVGAVEPPGATGVALFLNVSGEIRIASTASKMVIKAFQDSGASLNLGASSTDAPFRVSIRWVGKA